MSEIFYDEKIEKTEIFIYQINKNSMIDGVGIDCGGEIEIVFENDKFSRVQFPFAGSYSRANWKVLAEVEKKISEIEDMKKNDK